VKKIQQNSAAVQGRKILERRQNGMVAKPKILFVTKLGVTITIRESFIWIKTSESGGNCLVPGRVTCDIQRHTHTHVGTVHTTVNRSNKRLHFALKQTHVTSGSGDSGDSADSGDSGDSGSSGDSGNKHLKRNISRHFTFGEKINADLEDKIGHSSTSRPTR
jgi:hypothetical protein